MRHSLVWALLLLVLCTVPGPGSAEGKETARIVIAEGNSFLRQIEGREPVVYGAGDTVLVEWDNGDCYVNRQIFQSQRPSSLKVFPVTQLKSQYGDVPSVLKYVRSNRGDETEAWNKAYRQWEKRIGVLTREVAGQYMSDLGSRKSADEAAEAAVSRLLASPLVASARVDQRFRQPGTRSRNILVKWAGLSDEHVLMLTPSMSLDWPQPRPMTLNNFKAFVQMLRTLESKGPVTIELRGGSLLYLSGPDALKRRGKS